MKLEVLPPERQPYSVEIRLADGMMVKTMTIQRAGDSVPQHSHEYDHVSVVAAGAVLLSAGGATPVPYHAVSSIKVSAGIKHVFTALTDGATVLCVHRTDRTGEVDVREDHQFEGTG